MAAQAMATSVQAEGSDELKEFLTKYESDLKNSIDPIYNALIKVGLDKAELLEFDTVYLGQTLEEEGLKKLHIGRLLKTLRKIPESQIYNEAQTTVVVLSSEEEKALNGITSKSKQFKENITTITNTINELNVNYKSNQQVVNTAFDEIINVANTRRNELLEKVRILKESKNDKLVEQMNNIKEYDEKLIKSYDDAQAMIQNKSYDATKRKTKIVSTASDLLKGAAKWNDFKVSTTGTIHTVIDVKDFINKLSLMGDVGGKTLPKAPVVATKSIKGKSVTLNIVHKDDIIGYKVQYAEVGDDDMKVEWKTVEVDGVEKDVEYELGSLKRAIHYVVSVASKNEFGYGNASEMLRFKTNAVPNAPVVTIEGEDYDEVYLRIVNQDDITGYKIQYAKLDDDVEEIDYDSINNWKTVEVDGASKNVQYTVEGLETYRYYAVSVTSKNQFGYGNPCKPLKCYPQDLID